MEHQFILRVPEDVRQDLEKEIEEMGYPTCEIETTNNNTVIFKHKGQTYNTSTIKLPCVVDSHKTMDKKQYYKIADISTMLYVHKLNTSSSEMEKERKVLEVSGLTPPMKYAKIRRFRKRSAKTFIIEEIENKVKSMLDADKDALSVEVSFQGGEVKEESEEDVSSLAAEIEYNLISSEKVSQPKVEQKIEQKVSKDESIKYEALRDLEQKIKEKEEYLKAAPNIIVQKRFQEAIRVLKEEYQRLKDEIDNS